jgi:dephospho-CoA kinase
MQSKKLTAITGYPGTGKTELAKHMDEKFGFHVVEGSDVLKAMAIKDGEVLTTRDTYERYFKRRQLQYGMAWLTDYALRQPFDRIHHAAIRTRYDVDATHEYGGIVVALVCPPEICIDRIDTSNPKNPKTIEEYDEHVGWQNSTDDFGSHTQWSIDHADFTLDTSKPLEATLAELDGIVTDYLGA